MLFEPQSYLNPGICTMVHLVAQWLCSSAASRHKTLRDGPLCLVSVRNLQHSFPRAFMVVTLFRVLHLRMLLNKIIWDIV
jgi:hypothetical protein